MGTITAPVDGNDQRVKVAATSSGAR